MSKNLLYHKNLKGETMRNVRAELVSSLEERVFSAQSMLQVLDFVDRTKGWDLHDQLHTADELMEQLNSLVLRMRSIVEPKGEN
jgi:hypothetical protein